MVRPKAREFPRSEACIPCVAATKGSCGGADDRFPSASQECVGIPLERRLVRNGQMQGARNPEERGVHSVRRSHEGFVQRRR